MKKTFLSFSRTLTSHVLVGSLVIMLLLSFGTGHILKSFAAPGDFEITEVRVNGDVVTSGNTIDLTNDGTSTLEFEVTTEVQAGLTYRFTPILSSTPSTGALVMTFLTTGADALFNCQPGFVNIDVGDTVPSDLTHCITSQPTVTTVVYKFCYTSNTTVGTVPLSFVAAESGGANPSPFNLTINQTAGATPTNGCGGGGGGGGGGGMITVRRTKKQCFDYKPGTTELNFDFVQEIVDREKERKQKAKQGTSKGATSKNSAPRWDASSFKDLSGRAGAAFNSN